MARSRLSVATLSLAVGMTLAGSGGVTFAQAADEDQSRSRRPPPGNIKPLPNPQPVPMPPGGGRTPLPGSRPPADPPPPRDPPPRNRPPRDRGPDNDNTSPGDAIDHARDLEDDARRRHGLDSPGGNDRRDRDDDDRDEWRRRRYRRPGYYDYWRYDRYPRYYDDGYRGYDPQPQPPVDRDPTEPPGGEAGPGGLLPPDDLMDEDVPADLRRALEASPQYREATAQLLRAWAAYARAAEQVLQRLRPSPVYQRALADLRKAEAKVAAIRDRGGNVPAVNLVSAAQEAMLARRAVRAQEEKAIDADPVARRARQQVDEAIERRNKIRDDIAAKLPAEDK